MKNVSMAALMLALVCMTGPAAAKSAPAAPFKLSASGGGVWSVKCEVEIGNGNIDHFNLHPDKGGQASFANDKFKRVSCEYRAASNEALTMQVEAANWACPLATATPDKCEQVVAPGKLGSFSARAR